MTLLRACWLLLWVNWWYEAGVAKNIAMQAGMMLLFIAWCNGHKDAVHLLCETGATKGRAVVGARRSAKRGKRTTRRFSLRRTAWASNWCVKRSSRPLRSKVNERCFRPSKWRMVACQSWMLTRFSTDA